MASAHAQGRRTQRPAAADTVAARLNAYADSLRTAAARIDSLAQARREANAAAGDEAAPDGNYYLLFVKPTYDGGVAHRSLSATNGGDFEGSALQNAIDSVMLSLYLRRPDLVQRSITPATPAATPPAAQPEADDYNAPKLEDDVADAPQVAHTETAPVAVVVKKPNFWKFKCDTYLQFMQNHVSDNWYKGGESNYAMLTNLTLYANYNNKQKVKWDNTLEIKLGIQTAPNDTLRSVRTSQDVLRLTSKLGLQAAKRWYYTLQLIATTQMLHGFKANDSKMYSAFFAPLTVNLSLGMDYNLSWFKNKLHGNVHFAPVAFNDKYVCRRALATSYGIDEGKKHKTDVGSEISANLVWDVMKNVSWTARIYAYTTYHRVEMEFENTINLKINKFLSGNILLYPRFDNGVDKQPGDSYWQFREYTSFGLAYTL